LPYITNFTDVEELRFVWLTAILFNATAIVIQMNLRITKKYLHDYNNTINKEIENGSMPEDEENK